MWASCQAAIWCFQRVKVRLTNRVSRTAERIQPDHHLGRPLHHGRLLTPARQRCLNCDPRARYLDLRRDPGVAIFGAPERRQSLAGLHGRRRHRCLLHRADDTPKCEHDGRSYMKTTAWGRRDSNPHWRRFKRPASTDWATSPQGIFAGGAIGGQVNRAAHSSPTTQALRCEELARLRRQDRTTWWRDPRDPMVATDRLRRQTVHRF